MRTWYILSLLLFATATAIGAATATAPAAAPTIRISSIQTLDPFLEGELSLGRAPGTTVIFRVELSDGIIIGLDRTASAITTFTDDKGTNLFIPDETKRGSIVSISVAGFGFCDVSKDQKKCAVDYSVPKIPVKGATSISVKGEIALAVAGGSKDVAVEGIEPKVDTKFTLGDLPVFIKSINLPKRGGGAVVTIGSDRDMTALDNMDFFGPDGKKLELKWWDAWSKTGKEREYTFAAATLPATVKVVAKVWTDFKTVNVPFDLKGGLGL